MAGIKVTLVGVDVLEAELARLNAIELEAIQKKQVTKMLNRAKNRGSANGTPVDTGELKNSSSADMNNMEMGYTAEYAPHIEYGHRTRNCGYLQGQRFWQANVDRQREIYKTDIHRSLLNERSTGTCHIRN